MRLYGCKSCGQTVFFENSVCERCGHELGFSSESQSLLTLERDGDFLRPLGGGADYLYCSNAQYGACNWLLPAAKSAETDGLCDACSHNRTIPDLSITENLEHWQNMETAKHRLFYSLLRLNLPHDTISQNPGHGLVFDFLADLPGVEERVLTGHDEGLITINLAEADDATRERFRTEMGEPYRTLLGHFRHEVGHYYWNVLVRDAHRLDACRAVFGDDTIDYGEALKQHYAQGEMPNWQGSYISSYATTHPWEDFAETWAHYLHIVDTLETAGAFGLRIHPRRADEELLHADIDFDAYKAANIEQLVEAWLPLTFAMNALNRSMGHGDMYPFVLSPPVIEKLRFIHELVHGRVPEDRLVDTGLTGDLQMSPNTPPPSQPPAPPGNPPINPPIEEPPVPGPDIQPPPDELPPMTPVEEPPPLQA